jgi:hypothetical protein
MALTPHGPAPYTTASAAIAAVDAYRERGLSTPITPDVLTRAQVPESIASRTLNSLKMLDLVDEAGEPTQQFKDLRLARGEDEYHERLQEWLRAVYAEVLQYTDPSTDSPDRVAEAFRTYEPAGQRRSMASLLIGLWRYSGLPVPSEQVSRPRPTAPRAPRRQAAPRSTPAVPIQPSPTIESTDEPGLPPGLVGLLRQIPRNGNSWTPKRRDDFLAAFTAVLDFSVPVKEPVPMASIFDLTREPNE